MCKQIIDHKKSGFAFSKLSQSGTHQYDLSKGLFLLYNILKICITHQRTLYQTLPQSGPDVVGGPGDVLQEAEGRLTLQLTPPHHDLPRPNARPDHDV